MAKSRRGISVMKPLQRLGGVFLAYVTLISSVHADPIPTGRLPDTAIPLSYVLNLTVDPRADRFTGQVRIRVN